MKSKISPVVKFKRLLETRNPSFLTKELYELLYIHSNKFIAHFNKDGFYRARFEDNDGFNNTIYLLATSKYKLKTSKENLLVNELINAAREYAIGPRKETVKESILERIRQALETVTYNESLKAYVISAKYWENLEPDTFNLYSNRYELKNDLINELIRRWG